LAEQSVDRKAELRCELPQMLIDENSDKAQRVMKSMLQMRKIDLDEQARVLESARHTAL